MEFFGQNFQLELFKKIIWVRNTETTIFKFFKFFWWHLVSNHLKISLYLLRFVSLSLSLLLTTSTRITVFKNLTSKIEEIIPLHLCKKFENHEECAETKFLWNIVREWTTYKNTTFSEITSQHRYSDVPCPLFKPYTRCQLTSTVLWG